MNASPNVDPQEIAKFNRVSNLWWDKAGKMGMLHVINPLRCDFVFRHVSAAQPRIVDIGCGGGILAEALAKKGAQVTGIDLSGPTLEVARRHAEDNGLNIDYRHQDVETLADEQAGQYDVVTCMEMLEHVPDPARIMAACSKLLKPHGQAFFSTINRTFKAYLFAIIGGEYILRILPRGTHQYEKLIKPNEMRMWGQAAGLDFSQSASLMYSPLTRHFKVATHKEDVNYMCRFIKTR